MRALAVLVLLAAASAQATTYYVDYLNGTNDAAGTGQTPCVGIGCTGPWRTPPGAYDVGNAAATTQNTPDTGTGWVKLKNGDTLRFHAGQTHVYWLWATSTWYPTTAGTRTTFGSYGSGARPAFAGGALLTDLSEAGAGWTAVGGQANVYSFPLTCSRLNLHGSPHDEPQLLRSGDGGTTWTRWAVGAHVTGNPSTDGFHGGTACTAAQLNAPGKVFYDCANNRYCANSATNPASDGSVWYVGFRPYNIRLEGLRDLTITGLHLFGKAFVAQATEFGGALHTSNSQLVSGLDVEDTEFDFSGGSGLAIFMDPGLESQNITIKSNIIHDSFMYGQELQNGGITTAQNILVQLNTSYRNGDHGLSCNKTNGCVIDQNTVYNNGAGQADCLTGACAAADQDDASGITLTGNGTNYTVTRNLGYHNSGCSSPCVNGSAALYLLDADGTNLIADNVFYANKGTGISLQAPKPTAHFQIYYNTLVDNLVMELAGAGGETVFGDNMLDVRNNILAWTSAITDHVFGQVGHQNGSSLTQVWDYNVVYNAHGTSKLYLCTGGYQSTPCGGTWQAHGVSANPAFVSTVTPDYHLAGGSPAVDVGVNLSATVPLDFDGLPRFAGAGSDLGAFEQSAGSTSTTTSTSSSTTTSTSSSTTTSLAHTGRPDWSSSMIAWWSLDQGGGNTRTKSGGTCVGGECDLFRTGGTGSDTVNKVQGTGSNVFHTGTADDLHCTETLCDELRHTTGPLSWGAWLRDTDDTAGGFGVAMTKARDAAGALTTMGYELRREHDHDRLECSIGDGFVRYTATGTTSSANQNAFHFGGCVYSGNTLQTYLDGKVSGNFTAAPSLDEAFNTFFLGGTTGLLAGNVDMAWVSNGLVLAPEQCSLCACDVDGAACGPAACDGTGYRACATDVDCGMPTVTGACDTTSGFCQGRLHAGSPNCGGCTMPTTCSQTTATTPLGTSTTSTLPNVCRGAEGTILCDATPTGDGKWPPIDAAGTESPRVKPTARRVSTNLNTADNAHAEVIPLTDDSICHFGSVQSCYAEADNNATAPPGQAEVVVKYLCGTRGSSMYWQWDQTFPGTESLQSTTIWDEEDDLSFCRAGTGMGNYCGSTNTTFGICRNTAGTVLGGPCSSDANCTDPAAPSCDLFCRYDPLTCPGSCCDHTNPGRRLGIDANGCLFTDVPSYQGANVTLSQPICTNPVPRGTPVHFLVEQPKLDSKAHGGHFKVTQNGIVVLDGDINTFGAEPNGITSFNRVRLILGDNESPDGRVTTCAKGYQYSASPFPTTTTTSTTLPNTTRGNDPLLFLFTED